MLQTTATTKTCLFVIHQTTHIRKKWSPTTRTLLLFLIIIICIIIILFLSPLTVIFLYTWKPKLLLPRICVRCLLLFIYIIYSLTLCFTWNILLFFEHTRNKWKETLRDDYIKTKSRHLLLYTHLVVGFNIFI